LQMQRDVVVGHRTHDPAYVCRPVICVKFPLNYDLCYIGYISHWNKVSLTTLVQCNLTLVSSRYVTNKRTRQYGRS
jgi:hypothetical protein